MWLTTALSLPRRMLNSPYHPMKPCPKSDRWWKRQRIFRFSAWFYGDTRDHYKNAFQHTQHSWKRQQRHLKALPQITGWFYRKRVDAALTEHNVSYYLLEDVMKKLDIRLNLKMLHFLAIYEPRSFNNLAMLAKQVGLESGMSFEDSLLKPPPEGVITRGVL